MTKLKLTQLTVTMASLGVIEEIPKLNCIFLKEIQKRCKGNICQFIFGNRMSRREQFFTGDVHSLYQFSACQVRSTIMSLLALALNLRPSAQNIF